MYNATKIKEAFIGFIGWKDNDDDSGWQLDDVNTSESGTFYNSVHPMLTMDNLISIAKRYNDLGGDSDDVNSKFTAWVKEETEQAILDAIDLWLERKFENRSVNNLLEDDMLFRSTGDVADIEEVTDEFIGMEFIVARGNGVVLKLREIGLQFENNTVITLQLFKSGVKAPIKVKDCDYIGNGSVQWFSLDDWDLSGDGAYWVGFESGDLDGGIVNGVKDYGYGRGGVVSFPTGRFFECKAISTTDFSGFLFRMDQLKYSLSTNYGMNFKLDVRCDYTNFIIDHKELFKRLIWLNVGIKFLEYMAFNPNSRVNRNEGNMDSDKIMYAIEGDTQKTKGGRDISLTGKRERALAAIAFDEAGLSSVCLPCKKKGVKYGSMGPVGFRG